MSQEDQIESYLKAGHSITPIEALDKFRCFRLASRISSLKSKGLNIDTRMIESNGKRYAQYFIPFTLEG